MGRQTSRSALGILDHNAHPHRRNFVLASLWDGDHHSSQCLYDSTVHRRGRLGLEYHSALIGTRSIWKEEKTSYSLGRNLPATNQGCALQEGEGSRIPVWWLGPQTRYPEYWGEKCRNARSQLGEDLYRDFQGRQMFLQLSLPRREDTWQAMKFFSFEVILRVNNQLFQWKESSLQTSSLHSEHKNLWWLPLTTHIESSPWYIEPTRRLSWKTGIVLIAFLQPIVGLHPDG